MAIWTLFELYPSAGFQEERRVAFRCLHLVDAFYRELDSLPRDERRAPFHKLSLMLGADPALPLEPSRQDQSVALVEVRADEERLLGEYRALKKEVLRAMRAGLLRAGRDFDWDPAVGLAILRRLGRRDPVNRYRVERLSRARPPVAIYFESDERSSRLWAEYQRDGELRRKTIVKRSRPYTRPQLLAANSAVVKGSELLLKDARGKILAKVRLD